jgi:hypothetical protein
MNAGKTLFAQIMDFLPWTTFDQYVDRYGGNRGVRSMTCAEQYRIMAFAQLTYRESLRDIEVCLGAQAGKLYHMGFRGQVKRSTLADANESRDWRIYADFGQRLIVQARELYLKDDLGLDLTCMPSTCCSRNPVQSMSWIVATSISADFMHCIWRALFSLRAPNPI